MIRKYGKSIIVVIVAAVPVLVSCIGLAITKTDFFLGALLISLLVYSITAGIWLGFYVTR